MAIIGIGVDYLDVNRFRRVIEKFPMRMREKLYDIRERDYCEAKGRRALESYAMRFAAKEACAKALGTGIARGVTWRSMVVLNDSLGKPGLELSGGARRRLEQLLADRHVTNRDGAVCHLTMTGEATMVCANVIIEVV